MGFCRRTAGTVIVCALLFALSCFGGIPATRPAGEAATALHEQIVKQYLASDWTTLAADVIKQREIMQMTKEQQADVAYIRGALAECRPAWWAQVKLGRPVTIRPALWQRPIVANWDPSLNAPLQLNVSNGRTTLSVFWQAAGMESKEPYVLTFTKGDEAGFQAWHTLEGAGIWISSNLELLAKLTPQERNYLDKFVDFRGTTAALYYGTPSVRRFAMFAAVQSFAESAPNMIPKRPVGAMLAAEFAGRFDRYPSLRVPPTLPADSAEKQLASKLASQLVNMKDKWTLAEDRALREAVRDFAGANGMNVFNSGRIALANKQTVALDVAADGDLATKRNKWLAEEVAKPHPATAPAK